MNFVIDASVALRWVIFNALTQKAIQFRDDFENRKFGLIAPAIYKTEIANALTKAERQKLVPVGDARRLIGNVLSVSPVFYSFDSLLFRAADISSQQRCGFYDCLYVALAERENCELITADDKLVRALQPTFPFIVRLADLP